MGATVGDVWRPYSKPSLDGLMVIRKRNTRQTSARLEERKEDLRALKGRPDAPATAAHRKCVEDGKAVKKKVYVPGVGYQEKDVCPIKEFKSYLREYMPT